MHAKQPDPIAAIRRGGVDLDQVRRAVLHLVDHGRRPRLISQKQAAEELNISHTWFARNRARLMGRGLQMAGSQVLAASVDAVVAWGVKNNCEPWAPLPDAGKDQR